MEIGYDWSMSTFKSETMRLRERPNAEQTEVSVLDAARRVIRMETESLRALEQRLDETFVRAVDVLARAEGRVIVSGIGKSGIIGRKIAATLTSTESECLRVLARASAVKK